MSWTDERERIEAMEEKWLRRREDEALKRKEEEEKVQAMVARKGGKGLARQSEGRIFMYIITEGQRHGFFVCS